MEWKRDNLTVTTDRARFDMEFVARSLQGAWRRGVSREGIEDAFARSLCFGMFDGEKQIGCVRVVTDGRLVAWVCDLFVDPAYRRRKLGAWLMECVRDHPDLARARLVLSSVRELEAFYRRLGFYRMERAYSMPPRGMGEGAASLRHRLRRWVWRLRRRRALLGWIVGVLCGGLVGYAVALLAQR